MRGLVGEIAERHAASRLLVGDRAQLSYAAINNRMSKFHRCTFSVLYMHPACGRVRGWSQRGVLANLTFESLALAFRSGPAGKRDLQAIAPSSFDATPASPHLVFTTVRQSEPPAPQSLPEGDRPDRMHARCGDIDAASEAVTSWRK